MIPAMAHAGEGYKVHMTGLTHDERGYPALDADTHNTLVNRLVDKVRLNARDIELYEELQLEDAETVVIAFGCTSRSARQAVRMGRSQGKKCGLLRLISIWPFPEDRIRLLLERSGVRQV